MQNKKRVTFQTFEVIDKKIYLQDIDTNVLACLKLDENTIEIVNASNDYCFKHCARLNNKLYLADNLGEVFVEFDTQDNTYLVYNLKAHTENNNNIVSVEANSENVFIVSQYKGIIFIFDTVNGILEQDEALSKKITKLFGEKELFIINCRKIDKWLYLIVEIDKKYYFWKYSMIEKKLEERPENIIFDSMRDVYYFEKKLYILQDDSTLCVWNLERNKNTKNKIETIQMNDLRQIITASGLNDHKFFSTLAVSERNVWLFPAGRNEDIYIYDFNEKTVCIYDEYPKDFFYLNKKNFAKYADIKEREKIIYVAAITMTFRTSK